MRPPQSVVVAALSAVPKTGPVAGALKDNPTDTVEVITEMIAAAVAAYPRAQCDQQGHEFSVYCTPDSIEPNLIICERCKTSWPMSPPAGVAPAPDPLAARRAAVSPPVVKKVSGAARKAKEAPAATAAAATISAAQAGPSSDPPAEDADEDEPDPVSDDPEDSEVDGEEEPARPGHCSSCGGEVESETFAAEVAKNFRGAHLCRDCLLTCETCGAAIETMDQARISAIRWKHRLCLGCHTAEAMPESA